MSLRSALKKIEEGLPIISTPEMASAVHWTPSESLPVHRWFRYREGFSPSLLKYFPDYTRRLDPFCGCGTTLLESATRGVHSYGIDLNPLATFVARTKTKRYSLAERSQFMHLGNEALKVYRDLSPVPVPPYDLLEKLFLPESIDTLLRLRAFINTVKPKKLHDLLLLAWLSILEPCSNVFKEGNGLKYRNKRRRPGRYVTIPDNEWIPRYFRTGICAFIEEKWREKSSQIAEDIQNFQFPTGYTPRIRTGSCFEPNNLDFGESTDLAIFSPPYANRFDYFEAFKMELWMGGFVKSQNDMALLRSKSMRNNLAARRGQHNSVWPLLSPFLDAMDESASSVRMGIKSALQGYFEDTRVLLQNLKSILVKHGKIVIVVGNSAYAKSIVPTDLLVSRIGLEEGYKLDSIHVARHLHVSSQQRNGLRRLADYMRESVVILEKR